MPKQIGSVAVIGGGIGGMQAALDLANSGMKVYLVESKPGIGGVMSMLDKTFPTNDCAMCTMAPRLVEVSRHKDIEVISHSDIEKIEGKPGKLKLTLKTKARFVDVAKCTGCGTCTEHCPVRNVVQLIPPEEKEKVEIAAEIKEKVLDIIRKYKDKDSVLLPLMEDLNEEYGYLPVEIIKYIAQEFNFPLSMIYRLATFYNVFSLIPKGKNIVRACMGTACYVKGGKRILDAIERNLNIKVDETTEDLKFSLETVSCLGCCGQSPVMTVNDDIYGYMKRAMVSEILRKYK